MSALNRQNRPTAELRAIQPARPWPLQVDLAPDVAARLEAGQLLHHDLRDVERVLRNRKVAERANWRGAGRAARRKIGQHGPGFRRASLAGAHVSRPLA